MSAEIKGNFRQPLISQTFSSRDFSKPMRTERGKRNTLYFQSTQKYLHRFAHFKLLHRDVQDRYQAWTAARLLKSCFIPISVGLALRVITNCCLQLLPPPQQIITITCNGWLNLSSTRQIITTVAKIFFWIVSFALLKQFIGARKVYLRNTR